MKWLKRGIWIVAAVAFGVVVSSVFAQPEPPMAPPSGMSQFENWDAMMKAQAGDAACVMLAVELYAPQPITDRIEAYVCPPGSPDDEAGALKKHRREFRADKFPLTHTVIVAIDERLDDLEGE